MFRYLQTSDEDALISTLPGVYSRDEESKR